MDNATTVKQRAGADNSLAEVFRSIPVPETASKLRKAFAFIGPGFLVSVGYMDPGNWATSLAGGSAYAYGLLWVVVGSSFIAMLLQSISARLGIATGKDLARLCRDSYPKPVVTALWLLAELAIIATDVAEVIGTAIGLQLVFGLAIRWGVLVTALDVFLLLALQSWGFRKLEAFIIALLAMIFISFVLQVFLSQPNWAQVAGGLVPSASILQNSAMLYVALGIIGATVMPHNIYLHSGLVLTRAFGRSDVEKSEAVKLARWDSNLALGLALLVNASILILAAAAFNAHGKTDVTDLAQARDLLEGLLGSSLAPKLFGFALLMCGLNSTVTATMAGQMVMEGFLRIRIAPVLRRLITRSIAIIPAIIATFWYGEQGVASLLIGSQVMLSLQLPFALVPLLQFASSRKFMGNLVSRLWISIIAGLIVSLLIALNVKLVWDAVMG